MFGNLISWVASKVQVQRNMFHHHTSSWSKLNNARIKSICKANGLNRRKNVSDDQLCKITENELNAFLSCVSYRQMTGNLCWKYGINVVKEDFREALTSVDPDKVNK